MFRVDNSAVTTFLLACSLLQIADSFTIPGHHSLLLTRIKNSRYDADLRSLAKQRIEGGQIKLTKRSLHHHRYYQMQLRSYNNNNNDDDDFPFFFGDADFGDGTNDDSSKPAEGSGNRNRIRNFFRSSKDENLVRPIALDGSLLDDSDDNKNESNDSRSVVRPKFDAFFKGAPGIGEILGPRSEMDENEAWKQSLKRQQQSQQQGVQDTNLDMSGLTPEDIEAIDGNFEKFQREMREKLAKLRQENPDAVPDNAEFILDQVVEEQRFYDLKEKKDARSFESFEEYQKKKEQEMAKDLESRFDNNIEDKVVNDILDETQRINDRREADERDLLDFAQYELAMKQSNELRLQESRNKMDSSAWNEDADLMQLKLMEDLLESRKKSVAEAGLEDEDIYTTDNLEDGIEELRAKIQAKRDGTQKSGPATLKDWQMYRAIATKMSEENPNLNVDENVIEQQLQAWKEFQVKEEDMRRKAGLTIKTRMPFPWSDKEEETIQQPKVKPSAPYNKIKSAEARSELDNKAVEMMESLISKTLDVNRRMKLERELNELKSEMKVREEALETLRNLPSSEQATPSNVGKKVDVSDIFRNDNSGYESRPTSFTGPATAPSFETLQNSGGTGSQSSPSPPFFSSTDKSDLSKTDTVMAAPKTPFFASENDGEDYDEYNDYEDYSEEDEENVDRPSLGTIEEQKFRSMVARSGVRTVRGQEELRQKWEDFQKAEAEMRSRTGLSEGTDVTNVLEQATNPEYDLSKFVKEGGDIDADAVLASIGQRPSRKNKKTEVAFENLDEDEEEETEYRGDLQTVPEESQNEPVTKWTGSNYADQLYRNVAAVNRGIGKNSDKKDESKAAFEEFLKKDEEMRQKMQNLSAELPVANAEDFDAESYAQNALSSMGSRPRIQRKKAYEDEPLPNMESELTDVIGSTGENETNELSLRKKINRSLPSSISEKMPNWLRREQEERGFAEEFNLSSEGADFNEDFSSEEDFEENLRQAEEFERKTSRAPKEISIGDIFGREYFGPDDYGDYYSSGKGGDGSFSSFEARKKDLLEYTELSVAELNKLMDYKNSALETGISPYLRMVNKPFSAFGGIFRLESVLVDLTGILTKAWIETAREHDLKPPSREDMKFAAVHKPDFVIQRVFYWTSDIFEVRHIVETFKAKLAIAFEDWIENNSEIEQNNIGISSDKNENDSSTDKLKPAAMSNLSQENMLNLRLKAWKKVAEQLKVSPPTMEMIFLSKPFSPDEAVRGVFKWTNSYSESMEIAKLFRSILKLDTKTWMTHNNIKVPGANENIRPHNNGANVVPSSVPSINRPQSQELELTNVKMQAWAKTAEMFDYKTPTVDEVQAASFIGVENAVSKVFKWSQDPDKVTQVVMTFRNYTKVFANGLMSKTAENMRQEATSFMSQSDRSEDNIEPIVLKDGVIDWIKSLQVLSFPCAIVSYLNDDQVDAIMQYTGLYSLFPNSTIVTSSDNYAIENQQMLGAALRIERRPDHCVMFDATQQATVAAHDVEMKSISIVDPYPYYELTTCDLSARDFESLGISRIRNVFSDATNQEPMQELQLEDPMRKRKPMLKTRFWEEGDRW